MEVNNCILAIISCKRLAGVVIGKRHARHLVTENLTSKFELLQSYFEFSSLSASIGKHPPCQIYPQLKCVVGYSPTRHTIICQQEWRTLSTNEMDSIKADATETPPLVVEEDDEDSTNIRATASGEAMPAVRKSRAKTG